MDQLKSSSECIIHCTDDNTELISLKDVASWDTLYDAAALRQYAPLLSLQYEGEIPNIRYHRKCRQIFTMKRELDKMREKKGHSKKTKSTTTSRKSIRLPSASSSILPPVCIFCSKADKFKKRVRENLTNCSILGIDIKLQKAALKIDDSRMIAIASTDLVASEAKYHFTCYRDYTRVRDLPSGEENSPDDYQLAEFNAFSSVKKFLEDLLENPDVVKFTELTKLMEDEMSKNEKVMNMSTKKNLRRKIENYTSKIEFRNIDSALYIIPETLSFDMLLEKFISVRNDVEYLRQLQKDDVAVINAAEIMRSEMKSSSSNLMSWPPTSDVSKQLFMFFQSNKKTEIKNFR